MLLNKFNFQIFVALLSPRWCYFATFYITQMLCMNILYIRFGSDFFLSPTAAAVAALCRIVLFSPLLVEHQSFLCLKNSHLEKWATTTTTREKKRMDEKHSMHHLMYFCICVFGFLNTIHHFTSDLKRNIIFDQTNASFRFNKLDAVFHVTANSDISLSVSACIENIIFEFYLQMFSWMVEIYLQLGVSVRQKMIALIFHRLLHANNCVFVICFPWIFYFLFIFKQRQVVAKRTNSIWSQTYTKIENNSSKNETHVQLLWNQIQKVIEIHLGLGTHGSFLKALKHRFDNEYRNGTNMKLKRHKKLNFFLHTNRSSCFAVSFSQTSNWFLKKRKKVINQYILRSNNIGMTYLIYPPEKFFVSLLFFCRVFFSSNSILNIQIGWKEKDHWNH